MENNNLFERVSDLGFPLFEVKKEQDANLTLADMVMSHDLRLWEGVPVVLVNSAEKGLFDYGAVNGYLKKPSDKAYFDTLVVLSLALYRSLNLKFLWVKKVSQFVAKKEKQFKDYLKKFKENDNLEVGSYVMSGQKLKSTFGNYFSKSQANLNELFSTERNLVKKELGLEYSLSQIFSHKQKELYLKKLKRKKLTKTEKEYFSRTVKKKVLALANPELHRLSQELLE